MKLSKAISNWLGEVVGVRFGYKVFRQSVGSWHCHAKIA